MSLIMISLFPSNLIYIMFYVTNCKREYFPSISVLRLTQGFSVHELNHGYVCHSLIAERPKLTRALLQSQ